MTGQSGRAKPYTSMSHRARYALLQKLARCEHTWLKATTPIARRVSLAVPSAVMLDLPGIFAESRLMREVIIAHYIEEFRRSGTVWA